MPNSIIQSHKSAFTKTFVKSFSNKSSSKELTYTVPCSFQQRLNVKKGFSQRYLWVWTLSNGNSNSNDIHRKPTIFLRELYQQTAILDSKGQRQCKKKRGSSTPPNLTTRKQAEKTTQLKNVTFYIKRRMIHRLHPRYPENRTMEYYTQALRHSQGIPTFACPDFRIAIN